MKTRRYMGRDIVECERVPGEHRGRWTVQTFHETGMPWADEHCPHFSSLAMARAWIRIQNPPRRASRDGGTWVYTEYGSYFEPAKGG